MRSDDAHRHHAYSVCLRYIYIWVYSLILDILEWTYVYLTIPLIRTHTFRSGSNDDFPLAWLLNRVYVCLSVCVYRLKYTRRFFCFIYICDIYYTSTCQKGNFEESFSFFCKFFAIRRLISRESKIRINMYFNLIELKNK